MIIFYCWSKNGLLYKCVGPCNFTALENKISKVFLIANLVNKNKLALLQKKKKAMKTEVNSEKSSYSIPLQMPLGLTFCYLMQWLSDMWLKILFGPAVVDAPVV